MIERFGTILREYLVPKIDNDEFRREMGRQSRVALAVIGGIQIAAALFLLLARFLVTPAGAALSFRVGAGAVIILLGILNLLLSRVPAIESRARLIAGVSGVLTALVLIWSTLLILSQNTNPDDFIPGQVTMIMLVGVAIMPLRPMHALWLGVALGIVYSGCAVAAQQWLNAGTGPDQNYLLFIVMLTMLCVGITAVVYRQRRAAFAFQQAQARMMLAENAESMTKFAASLSHELNNPMGALLSGVDTLVLLAAKQATCPPSEQQRLVLLQADLRKSVQQSVNRLKQLVARLQRFTNLDQADVQDVNVNDLLSDVAALVRPHIPDGANLELELQPVPPVTCRPQQLSAVFNTLVQNAVQALDGTGLVCISTRARDSQVEIEIRDNGRGVDPAELPTIFDPGFKVTGTRVRAGHWGLFSSRQIVREHGGDIRITSKPGDGTSVLVTLPLESALTEASLRGSDT
jgi:signal transduction histidine kinase